MVVAVISHDAGGAEILSSWVLRQDESYLLVLDGPARAIFERKLKQCEHTSLDVALSKADWVLTGTSWQSDLEIVAIQKARDLKKKSASFLDHWVNYKERFQHLDIEILPDEIWVGDDDALKLANELFPDTTVRFEPNPYFMDIKDQFNQYQKLHLVDQQKPYILYVCSPLREHGLKMFGDERYWGFTEEDAVRYFMSNIHVLEHESGQVVMRPHPSEEPDKYDWAIREFGNHIRMGGKRDLLEEIFAADTVVGYNSMAMVVGVILGKRVVDALPSGKVKNTLPLREIEAFSDLLQEAS